MTTFYTIFGFIFGAVIGSFLNVVIYRLYKGKNIGGFSACPYCKHRLTIYDLIPIASFFLLSGRCRYCSAKISIQYPLVEAVSGVLFAVVAYRYAISALTFSASVFDVLFVSVLIVIFSFDLLYYIIPDEMVALGVGVALVQKIFVSKTGLTDGLWGALLVAGFFAVLFFVSRGAWIGFGDVKLGVFLGLLLGLMPSLLMLLLAYVAGAIVGVSMVAAKRRSMKGVLPFGTFLTAATVVMLLWGGSLQGFYEKFFYM